MSTYLVTYLNLDGTQGQITMSDTTMQCGAHGVAVYIDGTGQPSSQEPYTMVFQPWSRILRITAVNAGPPSGSM